MTRLDLGRNFYRWMLAVVLMLPMITATTFLRAE